MDFILNNSDTKFTFCVAVFLNKNKLTKNNYFYGFSFELRISKLFRRRASVDISSSVIVSYELCFVKPTYCLHNFENIPQSLISELDGEILKWVTQESNYRKKKELSDSFSRLESENKISISVDFPED